MHILESILEFGIHRFYKADKFYYSIAQKNVTPLFTCTYESSSF